MQHTGKALLGLKKTVGLQKTRGLPRFFKLKEIELLNSSFQSRHTEPNEVGAWEAAINEIG